MEKYVLIIDDDPDDFELLKGWAESMDFVVLPCDHSKMTKAIGKKKICDFVIQQIQTNFERIMLVLCDIKFRENYQGGNKVVEEIRKLNIPFKKKWSLKVPIYGVTRYKIYQGDIINSGADDVIDKDLLEEDLKNNNENKWYEKSFRNKITKSVSDFEKYLLDNFGKVDRSKVFIVHGHNDEVRQKVTSVLEHLKLEPIVLHDRIDLGRTIIEKFEANGTDVGYAIILLTADDVGRLNVPELKEEDNKPRARQNVIFEMGYFMSLLSRSNVAILYEDNVELPSDLGGLIYIPYKNGWELRLVKELKACGYDVSADDL